MAIAVATAESSTDSGASPHQILMPASVASGDLLLAIVDRDAAGGNGTLTVPTDWTELVQNNTASFHLRYAVWYKVSDASEGADEDFATSIVDSSAHHCYRITGQHASTAPAISTLVSGTDTAPDAGSFNPSWGSEETLWITGFFMRDPRSVSAVPTGYTQHPDGVVGADGSRVASAYKVATADSDDPAAWTIAVGGGTWYAWTIAVRAAASNTPIIFKFAVG